MRPHHRVYLILGSNIEPELNLQKAIGLLRFYGSVRAVSSIWESGAVGTHGPNFLNAAILFLTGTAKTELKPKIIRPIERSLRRVRGKDKNAARTIDIDILMVDDNILNVERWNNAYVVLPLAELLPDLLHPLNHKKLSEVARELHAQTWMVLRPEIPPSFD